jgi:hypothetical protein
MNQPDSPVQQIKIGLAALLLAAVTGCAGGYVEGYGYGGPVVVDGPAVGIYGGGYYGGGYYGHGFYDRGGDVHGYSHRGYASRGAAHGGGRGGGARR